MLWQSTTLLGLPLSVLHGVGEECYVSQGELGVMWRKLFASCANPMMCSLQWNPLHKGFSGYRAITPSQYVHLPTFLMSRGSGFVIETLDFPEQLSKWCAIVRFHTHTQSHELWKPVLPWETRLSNPISPSVINIWSCGWLFFYFKYRRIWLKGYQAVKKAFSKTVWD